MKQGKLNDPLPQPAPNAAAQGPLSGLGTRASRRGEMAGHWGNWTALLPGWSTATSAIVIQLQAVKAKARERGLWCCNPASAAPSRLVEGQASLKGVDRVGVCVGGIFRGCLEFIGQRQERHCLSLCYCYRCSSRSYSSLPSLSPRTYYT